MRVVPVENGGVRSNSHITRLSSILRFEKVDDIGSWLVVSRASPSCSLPAKQSFTLTWMSPRRGIEPWENQCNINSGSGLDHGADGQVALMINLVSLSTDQEPQVKPNLVPCCLSKQTRQPGFAIRALQPALSVNQLFKHPSFRPD